MLEPFSLPFVQRGIAEILLLAVPAGLLGTWIVLRGLAFFSHGAGAAAFPGVVLASGLGFSSQLGAFGAALAFGAAAIGLARGRRTGTDSATALALAGCLAAGVILASDVFHTAAGVEGLLFGSLLLIRGEDLLLAGGAAAVVLAATLLVGPRWLAAGFDPAAARPSGAGGAIEALLPALIALVVTAALTAVGAILIGALLVVPAATARLLTGRMLTWQIASILLVAVEGVVALWASVKTDAPPGATLAVIAGAAFVLVAVARRLRPAAAAAAATAIAAALAGCSSSTTTGSGDLKVVATTTQIGDLVREVAGPGVVVDQILQPNTDPHTYEPRPSDVEDAAGARLVFVNGDGLDAWAPRLVDESGSGARIVDLGRLVPVRLPGTSSGPEASRYDPHWWGDPRNAEAAVRAIASRLERAAPSQAGGFRRRTGAYLARLRALDRAVRGCMASIPPSERRLVTDHDAFGYFARRYGVDVVGAVIPSQTTDAEPSAKSIANLVAEIRRERVKAVFPESSINPKLAQTIAAETRASSDHTLYGDTLGPSGSSAATYIGMERANADTMARGFTGGRHGCRFGR